MLLKTPDKFQNPIKHEVITHTLQIFNNITNQVILNFILSNDAQGMIHV